LNEYYARFIGYYHDFDFEEEFMNAKKSQAEDYIIMFKRFVDDIDLKDRSSFTDAKENFCKEKNISLDKLENALFEARYFSEDYYEE
jgi:hypothetical protein